ncbi:MAG: hypothetical protein J7K89_05165, partial [Candidatus Cloacimonetes bacterium]|nr:hypothetical protein [Candidatus Cloacimonadota bacterium]
MNINISCRLSQGDVGAGDFISLDPRTIVTASGFIKSRHLDDKATALIRLAKEHKLN